MYKRQHLNLGRCGKLTGDLGALHGLTQLTHLNLRFCEGLTGDLGPLKKKFGLKLIR